MVSETALSSFFDIYATPSLGVSLSSSAGDADASNRSGSSSRRLIDAARIAGGVFQHQSYAEFVAHPAVSSGTLDVVAFNFFLFEEEIRPILIAANKTL